MESVSGDQISNIPEEDFLRAQFYAFLAQLLAKIPDDKILASVRELEGDDSPMGTALKNLAKTAKATTLADLEDEFTRLFYGQGQGGEILPYASYYLSGLLYDQALSRLRADMKRMGIERSDQNKEPEDHIAYLCEMMHGLILGRFEGGSSLDVQRDFFESHIASWSRKFFQDLEAADNSSFYMSVAQVGRIFMEIETDAFKMAAA